MYLCGCILFLCICEKNICEIYDAFISVYVCVCIRSIASVLSMEAVRDVVSVAACVAVCVAACVAACVAVCYSVLQ